MKVRTDNPVGEASAPLAAPKPNRLTWRRLRVGGWWPLFVVSTLYGLFALALGVVEVLSWIGLANDAKPRAVPVVFAAHAVAGALSLPTGALQFNRRLRSRNPRLHRLVGRGYVTTAWLASLGGIWLALYFDVSTAAKATFIVAATLWFSATTIAYQQVLRRNYRQHREWMIRSFALALFFVTFELWRTALQSSGLPDAIAYPLGLTAGWAINLVIAEHRIRNTR